MNTYELIHKNNTQFNTTIKALRFSFNEDWIIFTAKNAEQIAAYRHDDFQSIVKLVEG